MNKNAFSNDNILALKDASKAYPTVTPTSILKWRFTSKDENMIPLVSMFLYIIMGYFQG